MLITIIVADWIGIVYSIIYALFILLLQDFDIYSFLFSMLSGIYSSTVAKRAKTRIHLIRASIYLFVVNVFILLMIGFLKGIIIQKQSDSIVIDVRGIGYELHVPVYTWQECQLQDKKEFFVYTHVREQELSLFGFTCLEDKQVFQNILNHNLNEKIVTLEIYNDFRGLKQSFDMISDILKN